MCECSNLNGYTKHTFADNFSNDHWISIYYSEQLVFHYSNQLWDTLRICDAHRHCHSDPSTSTCPNCPGQLLQETRWHQSYLLFMPWLDRFFRLVCFFQSYLHTCRRIWDHPPDHDTLSIHWLSYSQYCLYHLYCWHRQCRTCLTPSCWDLED